MATDHNYRSRTLARAGVPDPPPSPKDVRRSPSPSSRDPASLNLAIPRARSSAAGTSPSVSPSRAPTLQRPSLARPPGSEKPFGSTTPNGSAAETTALSPSSPSGRKGSWLSGFTSKFSSSPPSSASSTPPPSVKPAPEKVPAPPQPRRASLSEATPPPKDESVPYTPAAPKQNHQSFLQSALRRLSSSSGQTPGASKVFAKGGICERRVMNINPCRDRCQISEFNQAKLKRVAFCVDVEIAGGPRYVDDEVGNEKSHKHNKDKEKRLKERGEGQALKHPEQVQEQKETEGAIKVDGKTVEAADTSAPPEVQEEESTKDSKKKKEKKKKSEEERKGRKEKKRRQAEANGTVPIETVLNGEESTPAPTPPGASTPRSQDRPTTDPLRIYRRCCQLRETPVLKKITEQLSMPTSKSAATPGVINVLDLSGYWMQLPDFITLSDWLAVVPVRKLILDNCGLGDEAARVILAGLLSAKFPDTSNHRPSASDITRNGSIEGGKLQGQDGERSGVIEKLVLKNNPKIGPEGWKHIGLFLHLSKSIKAIDLSMIPFARAPSPASSSNNSEKTPSLSANTADGSLLFSKAIAERLAGNHLEELVMSECDLTTTDVINIVDGVSKIGLKRLGLASNRITQESLEHIARFVKAGKCEGLDIGGNDLQGLLHIIAESLHEESPLWALSIADCNLTPSSLSKLFPALASLPSCRFIDLSHNQKLFGSQPDALWLCRKYLPRFGSIKRFHLADVSLTAEHAIALADILPECSSLAHLSILENPKITALANAKDEPSKEEACALYASLMAAVRVSRSIISIDVDIPSPDSSEIVKALAKQVVAYSLRNMEHGTVAEYSTTSTESGSREAEKVILPDVLMHIVGHDDSYFEHQDMEEPAPDEDYVIGGTGVVKALAICLGSTADDSQRPSRQHSITSAAGTPKGALRAVDYNRRKPKDVSKNLLASARKIRARLTPALAREAKADDEMSYRRLLFLDQTLDRIIHRFEDEYPECRLGPLREPTPPNLDISNVGHNGNGRSSSPETGSVSATSDIVPFATDATFYASDEEDGLFGSRSKPMERNPSDVSLASKALSNEEGRMHRFGQQVRRSLLRPQMEDHAHGTTGEEPPEPSHILTLRDRIAAMPGDELKDKMNELGIDEMMKRLGASIEELKLLSDEDPEAFEAYRVSQILALKNTEVGRDAVGASVHH
ncbi:MAG: hypothetical protein M1837_005063 [Sclerophora amabilis]|nr:MAG: hypothetical protein M1837_005063 [Sclerophora amabilis]